MLTSNPIHYPFSAVIGQHQLKTALLLAACDPALGGVLISGNRGTAKSTLARSLADLLENRAFVNCPLGVSEDRLLGSLDVEQALSAGKIKFSAGLFAEADGGVLYVDEINLLPDHLVDLLLDVSASGINYLERDGVSHQHSARFLLIGSMNPEEGALRPQLLDRFGLSVAIHDNPDLPQRLEIVAARLAFDHDPDLFYQQYAVQQEAIRQQLAAAQQRLNEVTASTESKVAIAKHCMKANVEGVRADLALYRAARAHTAMRLGYQIEKEDIDAVTALVLAHRRQENSPPPSSPSAAPTPQQYTESDNTSPVENAQGDWGEMPVETVSVGLSRQLDLNKFSRNRASPQKKKR